MSEPVDAIQVHYARIMCEGGCQIEDIAATLGMRLCETIIAIAPALKSNPRERKRARRVIHEFRLPPISIRKNA